MFPGSDDPSPQSCGRMYAERLRDTLPRVREEIADAARRVGRDPEEITLVAVTKSHPMAAIRAALAAGLRDLGENRVAELEEKRGEFGRPEGVRWHMIGTVQSRKAARLVGLADLVHSVDRLKIARKISAEAAEQGVEVPVLAQVNTSGEDAKSGFEGDPERVVERLLEMSEMPGLRLEGLMTMAPFVDDETILRPAFARLRDTLEELRRQSDVVGATLSMGMTNDLTIAIEEGSTMVRIGTALFGSRPGYEGA